MGADIVVTGRYFRWGQSILKVSIRAINVSDGKILAANKVKILTDRIAELLKPEKKEKYPRAKKIDIEEKAAPKKKAEKFSLKSPLITTGREYSGAVTEDPQNKQYGFSIIINIILDDGSGKIAGRISWPSEGSVHRISGTLVNNNLKFTEIEYIKKGKANLNCTYSLQYNE